MKAADGVQIAERYTAQYAVTMAQKNTWPREYVKQLIEDLSRAEERAGAAGGAGADRL